MTLGALDHQLAAMTELPGKTARDNAYRLITPAIELLKAEYAEEQQSRANASTFYHVSALLEAMGPQHDVLGSPAGALQVMSESGIVTANISPKGGVEKVGQPSDDEMARVQEVARWRSQAVSRLTDDVSTINGASAAHGWLHYSNLFNAMPRTEVFENSKTKVTTVIGVLKSWTLTIGESGRILACIKPKAPELVNWDQLAGKYDTYKIIDCVYKLLSLQEASGVTKFYVPDPVPGGFRITWEQALRAPGWTLKNTKYGNQPGLNTIRVENLSQLRQGACQNVREEAVSACSLCIYTDTDLFGTNDATQGRPLWLITPILRVAVWNSREVW